MYPHFKHLLLKLSLFSFLLAQDNLPSKESPGERISSFVSKQNEMVELIRLQKPLLEDLHHKIEGAWNRVQYISEQAKYPNRVPLMRDTALVAIAKCRKIADEVMEELYRIHFEWFYKNWDLMAVYTRYGELLCKNQVDENLKTFLLQYRSYIRDVEAILKMVKDLKNETDFLLSSKFD